MTIPKNAWSVSAPVQAIFISCVWMQAISKLETIRLLYHGTLAVPKQNINSGVQLLEWGDLQLVSVECQ